MKAKTRRVIVWLETVNAENCIRQNHKRMQYLINVRSKGQSSEFGFCSKCNRKQIEVVK